MNRFNLSMNAAKDIASDLLSESGYDDCDLLTHPETHVTQFASAWAEEIAAQNPLDDLSHPLRHSLFKTLIPLSPGELVPGDRAQ